MPPPRRWTDRLLDLAGRGPLPPHPASQPAAHACIRRSKLAATATAGVVGHKSNVKVCVIWNFESLLQLILSLYRRTGSASLLIEPLACARVSKHLRNSSVGRMWVDRSPGRLYLTYTSLLPPWQRHTSPFTAHTAVLHLKSWLGSTAPTIRLMVIHARMKL